MYSNPNYPDNPNNLIPKHIIKKKIYFSLSLMCIFLFLKYMLKFKLVNKHLSMQ